MNYYDSHKYTKQGESKFGRDRKIDTLEAWTLIVVEYFEGSVDLVLKHVTWKFDNRYQANFENCVQGSSFGCCPIFHIFELRYCAHKMHTN